MRQVSGSPKYQYASALVLAACGLTFTGARSANPALFNAALASKLAPAPQAPTTAAALANQIARGEALLEANDQNAVPTLRDAAQQSLVALFAITGPGVITAPPETMPTDRYTVELIRQATEAHYNWGLAAKHFGNRDASITAFSRAARLAGIIRADDKTLARDALLELSGALQEGLPDYAPDDTLETIATVAHGNLWQPRRFRFDTARLALEPSGPPVSAAGGQVALATAPTAHEFLITSGKLFPPFLATTMMRGVNLARIPPLYRHVPVTSLPPVLQLDKMIVGYERETDGPNRGLWHKIVNTFYASPYLTKDRRDDRPRAEALCVQFLKMHALVKQGLGLDNPYSNAGVTTLWLSEVSAWWPQDDDDPAVQDALGTRMPLPNTPIVMGGKKIIGDDIKTTPLSHPWGVTMTDVDSLNTVRVVPPPGGAAATAPGPPGQPPLTTPGTASDTPGEGAATGAGAGQIDSAWGEIMFFKMTEPRQEAEWLREIAHEYGHVSIPPFNGFQPPQEPYGNGLIGETLGMLWLAAIPNQFAPDIGVVAGVINQPAPATTNFVKAIDGQVGDNAVAALRFWNTHGPGSSLRAAGTAEGLEYLQGLAVYLERVYGARVLGATLKPLVEHPALTPLSLPATIPVIRPTVGDTNTLNAAALLESSANALREAFAGGHKTLPIWLPGALDLPATKQTLGDFIARAPLQLAAGSRTPGWLQVPPSAATLHIEWQTSASKAGAAPTSLSVEGGWPSRTEAATVPGATGATVIAVGGRQGWQRFAFAPSTNLTLLRAWFERKSDPARAALPSGDTGG